MSKFNPANFRKDFYHLTKDQNKSLVFDTVSGGQMPDSVIEAIAQYYRADNSNMAGVFKRSVQTHEVMYEGRKIISEFIATQLFKNFRCNVLLIKYRRAFSFAFLRTYRAFFSRQFF